MQCARHAEVEARGPCAVCFENLCDGCATYELEGAPCCERCGHDEQAQRDALSSGLLALVAVGYLATLAVGVVIFKARPFVGALAAIVAIGLGRAVQLAMKPPGSLVRRLGVAASVDAAGASGRPVDTTAGRL